MNKILRPLGPATEPSAGSSSRSRCHGTGSPGLCVQGDLLRRTVAALLRCWEGSAYAPRRIRLHFDNSQSGGRHAA